MGLLKILLEDEMGGMDLTCHGGFVYAGGFILIGNELKVMGLGI